MDVRVKLGETRFPEFSQPTLREGAGYMDLNPARDSLLRLVGGQIVQVEPAVSIGAVVARIPLIELEQLEILLHIRRGSLMQRMGIGDYRQRDDRQGKNFRE